MAVIAVLTVFEEGGRLSVCHSVRVVAYSNARSPPLGLMDRLHHNTASLSWYSHRIRYGNRATQMTEDGLFALNRSITFQDDSIDAISDSLGQQFTWSNRKATPRISLFSGREHARHCDFTSMLMITKILYC